MPELEFSKSFTPTEAKQTLPLVRKIVEDLLATGQRIRKYLENRKEIDENDPLLKPLLDQLNAYHNELEELGCFFKDWNYEIGLVDFPSKIDNEIVFLCWRSDESELSFYHSIEGGFKARKPILPNHFE